MWMVDPKTLCRNHLLGEHVECHMFVGTLNKGASIKGYIDKGLLEIHNLKRRHSSLVSEMKRRGFLHNSPLPKYKNKKRGRINIIENLDCLSERCSKCRDLIMEVK
jgi:hypothetical protein